MKIARGLIAFAASLLPAFGGYTYDYPSLLSPYNSSQWSANGSGTVSQSYLTSGTGAGISLLFGPSLPTPSTGYEVRTTLQLTSSGGYYVTYLHASPGSLLVNGNSGTYYAVEIANPTFSGSSCSASLNIYKSVSGSLSLPYTATISCHNGMVVRSVMLSSNVVAVYVDNFFETSWGWGDPSPITSGQPGVGVAQAPSTNAIFTVDIGHQDTIAPNPINASAIGTSSFPNHVDFQFPGTTDDPNGTGIVFYQWWRCTGTSCSVGWLGLTTTPDFSDTTVQPSTTYTYLIQAQDFHYNDTSVQITVTTPASGAIDPREVGVRSLGTYWGGSGEQLDMRSGNLNYTMPLFKAMSRGGWGLGFSLSYNSQNWRQDSGGTWQRGRDIGYGYGWKLQAGSLTPVYSNYYDVDHYLFIDATGAEYHLNVNNNGVWSSQESIYVYYDSNSGLLHFRDGSFWSMLCTSGGNEQDAGTMYPTTVEDSNGNQITVNYAAGSGMPSLNTSSRPLNIYDVRTGPSQITYSFGYNSDTIPHLTSIANNVQTSENYTFAYIEDYTLTSPFSGGTTYGTYTMLDCANSVTIPGSTTFAYDSASPQTCSNYSGGSGPGELSQMTTPGGGHLRWAYTEATYANSVSQPEVDYRYLLMSAGGTELTYTVAHSSDPTLSFHSGAALYDAGGLGVKSWGFLTSPSQTGFGLLQAYAWYPNESVNTGLHYESYGLSADSAGNLYISAAYSYEGLNTSAQIVKETTQTLDQYGNMTQMQQYNYGAPNSGLVGSLARTYTNTYLNSSAYTSAYILNRLATSTVTDGTHTTTLASNLYDGSVTNVSNITMHDSAYGTSNTTRGNLAMSTSPSGTKTTSYDIGGNVTSTTTNGVSTSVSTTSATNWAAPSQISTNSLSSSMNWTGFLGLSSATGPNGDTASIGYAGGSQRPTSSTSPTGAVTNYTYVDTGTQSKTATTNGHWVKTSYDGFGRTIETDTGYSGTAVSIVTTNYAPCGCSPLGKVSHVSEPFAPGGSPVYTTYNYDGMGRTTSTVAPDGSTTTYSYAGNTVTVSDPAGKSKTFTMDAFGNLTQVQENDPTLGAVYTTYTYDMLNHLTGVSMPRGSTTQTRTFNYTNGTTVGTLLLSATNPENGTVSYTYNPTTMTLATKTDAKGQVFSYSYDAYNRLAQISVGGNVLRTYAYDSNSDNPSYSQFAAGRLTEIKYPAISFVDDNGNNASTQFTDMFSYTQPGQMGGKLLQVTKTAQEQNVGTHQWYTQTAIGSINVAYAYNSEGKLTNVTYPTDSNNTTPSFSYTYDQMMRLSSMTDWETNYTQPVVNGVTYNAANRMTAINYYQQTETRSYNSLMQLTNITTNPPSNQTELNVTYNYSSGSNNGKISSTSDAISGETVTYQYDSLNRLISASGSGWTQTQAYDGFGNLTGRTGTGSASGTTISTPVNAATNQLSGYSYDANGNLLSTGYTYDAENRIAFANAGAVEYFYDAQNKRIWTGRCTNPNITCTSTTVDTEVVSLFGADGKLIGNFSVAGLFNNTTTNNVGVSFGYSAVRAYFGGKLVAQSYGGYLVATIQDRLGSVGKYYPYGEERNSPQLPNDQVKFATYTRDSATGNDYADQRYYSSALGRFMTPDPYKAGTGSGDARVPASWNRYASVIGDPINLYDPQGTTYCFVDPNTGMTVSCYDSVNVTASVGGGGGGGGGNPYVPSLMAPSDTAPPGTLPNSPYEWAQYFQDFVYSGGTSDCQALADFADQMASMYGNNTAAFIGSFGVLTPDSTMVQLLNNVGAANGFQSLAQPVTLQAPGASSGFASSYQDTLYPNSDQAHHFAAFLQFGAIFGATAGALAANVLELENGLVNKGDISLGTLAASLGADLVSGKLPDGTSFKPADLGKYLRNNICAH